MRGRLTHASMASNHGFTLIEVMVAIFMATFFITTTFFIVEHSNRSYRAQERVAAAQQDVRAGLDFMVREIRMAGYNPMGLSGASVIAADGTSFQFSMDTDRDNTLDLGQEEQITYTYDNVARQLLRSYPIASGTHSDVLIENVSALNFAYVFYDGDDVIGGGTPGQIGTVIITMTCQDRDAQGGTFDRTLTSSVKLRNFKS